MNEPDDSAGPRAPRWSEIEAALDFVLASEIEERDAALERACHGDERLRSEVASLLAAHRDADDFLETPALAYAAAFFDDPLEIEAQDEVVGSTIGRWTIEREIGRGGFGRVYLARRADGLFDQKVALKLVKRGMDSDEIVARFVHERRILARLEHLNIARLLDGGVSEDGRPFFVMENVEGLPITEQCRRRRSGVEDRLRLVSTVCRAVQHAHRNLVVHRDLKPTNVLVTATGEVKLLDFGIAKLLSEEDGEATATAFPGARWMTPEYASPEQVSGAPVTTASDVYQLGVLLYELLTGERPHAAPGSDRAAVIRSIRERDPRRPSTVVRQSGRDLETTLGISAEGAAPERLARRLRGDLDAVVLRALARAPEERYPSAEELAADLERHLEHQPVRARQASAADRAFKFVRRHRVAVATAALFVAFATGSAVFYTTRVRAERDRALAEADKVLESARLLSSFFRAWDPDSAERRAASAKQLFAASASQAERELAARPETLAATLSVLGDLNTSIGETDTAEQLLARAESLQSMAPGGESSDLAATLARRGRLAIERGDLPGAEVAFRRSLELHHRALGEAHPETIAVEIALARVVWMTQRPSEAEAILRGVVARAPAGERGLEARTELGYTLFEQSRYGEATALLRESLAGCRATLGPSHPLTVRTMRNLASALRDQGKLAESEALGLEVYRISRELYGDERIETCNAANTLAVLYERKGDFAEAERWERLAASRDDLRPQKVETASHARLLGAILFAQGETVESERLLRASLALLRQLYPSKPNLDEGDLLNRLVALADLRGAREADALYSEAVAFERARGGGPYFLTDGYEHLAKAAAARGDRELAETLYRRAVELYDAQLPPGHPYRVAAGKGLAELAASR